MAAAEVTPIDPYTRLPYPVVALEQPRDADDTLENFHHHFHPRTHPSLQEDGQALRASRGQKLPVWLHSRYHTLFKGPELPNNDFDRFVTIVNACAGFVSRHALDLSAKYEYREVVLSDDQLMQWVNPQRLHIERFNKNSVHHARNRIGRYFAHYALQQNITEAVSDTVIDEFLNDATSTERKKTLGNFILCTAIDIATEPVVPLHRELRRTPEVFAVKKTEPRHVVRKYFSKHHFEAHHDLLQERLLTA